MKISTTVALCACLAACSAGERTDAPAASAASVTSATVAAATSDSPTQPTTPIRPSATATAPAPSTTLPVASTTTSAVDTSTTDVFVESADCVRVTDFDEPDWVIVNDGVMGGRSVGGGAIVDGTLVFDGTIVTQGGGFSSVRGPIDGELVGATELVLRVRTDGRDYELLADDAPTRRQRVTHYAPIEVDGGEWQEVVVPLVDMDARVFGTPVDADPFAPDLATEIGVILADGLDGPFSFEIDWIDACACDPWAVRPGRDAGSR